VKGTSFSSRLQANATHHVTTVTNPGKKKRKTPPSSPLCSV
jgi:hypothetical protein